MIRVSHLSKYFGKRCIINNLTYEFNFGLIHGVIGQSGSGKSTLLNILGLLDTDYKGEITVLDTNYSDLNKREKEKFIRENISYLFQNYALIDDLTVEENLHLVSTDKNDILQALNTVGLSDLLMKVPVYTLSGGEQQRVALARCILKSSIIVLADEPTGNLDNLNRDTVMRILKSLVDSNKCVIIVSHDESIIAECDAVLKINVLE